VKASIKNVTFFFCQFTHEIVKSVCIVNIVHCDCDPKRTLLHRFSRGDILTGWPRRPAAVQTARRAVLNCVACTLLIHTFVWVAGRAAVHRCAWLDKYIAMRLFESLDASPFAPRENSHWRISRGQCYCTMPTFF
jgi:hypothetical protein